MATRFAARANFTLRSCQLSSGLTTVRNTHLPRKGQSVSRSRHGTFRAAVKPFTSSFPLNLYFASELWPRGHASFHPPRIYHSSRSALLHARLESALSIRPAQLRLNPAPSSAAIVDPTHLSLLTLCSVSPHGPVFGTSCYLDSYAVAHLRILSKPT